MALTSLDALKLIRNGPQLQGEQDLFSFIEYYGSIFSLNLPANIMPIAIITLKTQLKDKARQIIDINPHCDTWHAIKTTLIANLANLASLSTLTDQLITIQNNSSTLEFYNKIQELVAKILNKYRMDNPDATAQQIEGQGTIIRRIALRQFRDKLREPLRSLIVVRNPSSMEEALLILRESAYNLNDGPHQSNMNHQKNNKKLNYSSNYGSFKNNVNTRNKNNYQQNTNNNLGQNSNKINFKGNNNFSNQNDYTYKPNSEMSRIRRFGIPQPMDVDENSAQQRVNNNQNFHFLASNGPDPPATSPSLI